MDFKLWYLCIMEEIESAYTDNLKWIKSWFFLFFMALKTLDILHGLIGR